MAFITTEQVKERRQAIKEAFPAKLGWKFSVVRDNYSSIEVHVLEAPIELRNFDYESRFGERLSKDSYFSARPGSDRLTDIGNEVFKTLWDICYKGNFDKSDSMTDYFHVGWYQNIHVGKWNKGFKVSEPKTKTIPAKAA